MKEINKNGSVMIPFLLKKESFFAELVNNFKKIIKQTEKDFIEIMKPFAINGMKKIKKCKGKVLEELKRYFDNDGFIEVYDMGKIIVDKGNDNNDYNLKKKLLIEKICKIQSEMNSKIGNIIRQLQDENNNSNIEDINIRQEPISAIFSSSVHHNEKMVASEILENGEIFTGKLINGKPISGNISWPNGARYIGSWKDNLFDGKGIYTDENGSTFTGIFVKGKLNGEGSIVRNNGYLYNGYFENGLAEGEGKEKDSKFNWYEGTFSQGKKHGKGHYSTISGSVYDGNFKEGKMHGFGKLRTLSKIYEGNFANDKQEGYGKCIWNDGRIFEGNWHEGNPMENDKPSIHNVTKNRMRKTAKHLGKIITKKLRKIKK